MKQRSEASVTRSLSWEVVKIRGEKGKRKMEKDVMQRMKGIVGDWSRLVKGRSYLECTVVVLG